MASFKVTLKPSVDKDLRHLPKKIASNVLARIESLENEPFPQGVIKLEGSERLYRLRVGDYRIIYEADTDAKQIVIQYVRHRSDVYRNL
jgi:mRNA interferase RelE/StbE